MRGETLIHRIDAENAIEYVKDVWLQFAAENCDAAKPERIMGTSLWGYVSDPAVRQVMEVEDAIRELDLFDSPTMPPISHGICEECRDAVLVTVR